MHLVGIAWAPSAAPNGTLAFATKGDSVARLGGDDHERRSKHSRTVKSDSKIPDLTGALKAVAVNVRSVKGEDNADELCSGCKAV